MAKKLQKPEEKIFYQALGKSPSQREAYLAEVCGEDRKLYSRVEALLKVNDLEDDFLKNPLLDSELTLDNPRHVESPGTVIDRYKLLEMIGEGGFGVVWAAEQKKPVKRRVALKIIKLGMDTKQVVARFEAERQALAMMDHPNIAKVLDAGATDTGRPYFVMELVRGIPIIEYCDQAKLSIRDRLGLFIKVCHAIQHAHQKGIIHRDIKPSNILITLHDGVPVPRVIDFGIAKATQQELTEMTIYTQHNQFIGTPAYMSPEQAEMSGLDIDTRSDIYSLGVLLYELLTGRTPFDAKELMQSGIDQMRKIIREQEPQKPSTKFATLQIQEQSTTATRHATDSPKLISLLRGDLDWIVMKCLEKDRTRRYETANGLALDIVRHLRNEPVIARPPTVVYQLQKAWRRNKVVYTAACMVVTSLIIGISLSVWKAIEATRAEKLANTNAILASQNSELAEQKAVEARESQLNALRRAYGSDMSLAFRALEDNLFGRVQNIVSRHVPESEAPDFRGWEWRYAWAQSQSDALRAWDISEEMDEVYAVQISPDQRYMVSSGDHYGPTKVHSIRILWDFQTREELKNVHLPGGSPRALAFSDSGKLLAVHRQTANNVNEIHIYSTDTWRLDTVIQLDKWISCLLFSPDEKTLVTIGTSKAVLWDWRQQTPFHEGITSMGRGDSYCDLAFFPKGNRLAMGGAKELKIVDTHTGKIEYQQPAPGRGITALAVSPDGDYVAIGSGFEVSEIGLLNTSEENPDRWEQEDPLIGHSRSVTSLAFADNGKQLISSSNDSTIRVWDMKRRVTTGVLRGHQGAVYDISLTSDESRALSAGRGREILEWDPNANVPLSEYRGRRLAEHVREVFFSADSRSFYTIKGDGSVGIWDAETLNKKPWLSPELGEQSSIILSGDGKHLIAGTGSGKLWVLDAGNLQVVAEREVESELILPVGFSADGKSLVALESGNKISLWNVENWQCISSVEGVPKAEYHTRNYSAIPPGSDMLFYVSKADLLLWDLKQSKKLSALRVNPAWHGGGGAAVSPTEPLLAYFTRGRGLILWNWQTRQEEDKLPGAASRVDFSPDGRRLLTGGSGQIMLWDVSTRQEIARFDKEVLTILRRLKFSPDGNTICAVDINGTAYFWRAPSWDEIDAIEAGRNRKEMAR